MKQVYNCHYKFSFFLFDFLKKIFKLMILKYIFIYLIVCLSTFCFCFKSGQASLEKYISTNLKPRLLNAEWQCKQKINYQKTIKTEMSYNLCLKQCLI